MQNEQGWERLRGQKWGKSRRVWVGKRGEREARFGSGRRGTPCAVLVFTRYNGVLVPSMNSAMGRAILSYAKGA